ncbi:MAG: AEC family transporter [Neomegalonema sp.]|nr:AEC family transporter [Neomegalonema sp.]
MLTIFTLLLPIFLMIALGAAWVRAKLFPEDGLRHLNTMLLNVCVPVLVFAAVSRTGSFEALNGRFIFGYALGSLAVMGLASAILRYRLGYDMAATSTLSLGAGGGNSIFLGFPIAQLTMPDFAPTLFAWIIVTEVLIVIPVSIALAEWGRGNGGGAAAAWRSVTRLLLRSPVMIGLAAGVAFIAVGMRLPEPLAIMRDHIIAAAPMLALFLIGGSIATAKLAGLGSTVMVLGFLKLLVHPALVYLTFALLLDMPERHIAGAVLFAAMPMMALFTIFAIRHGVGQRASAALVVATLASIFTIPAILSAVLPA